jgi:hypothetical protein
MPIKTKILQQFRYLSSRFSFFVYFTFLQLYNIKPNGKMPVNGEFGDDAIELAITCFKIVFQLLTGTTEEAINDPQSRTLVPRLGTEPIIS